MQTTLPYPVLETLAVEAVLKPERDAEDQRLIAAACAAIAQMRRCSNELAEKLLEQIATEL